jgi:protein O-mannosyl-transferase
MALSSTPDATPPTKSVVPLWGIALVPAFLTFLFYLPVLKNNFVNWDDSQMILDNPHIRGLGLDSIGWMFAHFYGANWIPLTWLSLAIDFKLGNLDPSVYHLNNLLLHSCNTVLVFFLGLKILSFEEVGLKEKWTSARWAIPASFLTALLFGLHPLHVESVAWVTERKDLLCGFFYLLTLLVYLDDASASGPKAWKSYACLCLFAMALLSKPMAISLPLVLLLLDIWPLKRFYINPQKIYLEKFPFFIAALISGCTTIIAHSQESPIPTTGGLPLDYRVMNAFHSLAFYLVKMVVPVDLAALYPIVLLKTYSLEYVASFLAVVLVTWACFVYRKNRPYLAVGWFFYLVTLAPALGIEYVDGYAAADHFTYLPSLGPFLLFSSVVAVFLFNRRFIFILLALGLAILLGVGTLRQLGTWKDSVSLWENEVKVASPYVPDMVYERLGEAYMAAGRWDDALGAFNSALATVPEEADLHEKKGIVLINKGLLPEAATEFKLESSLDPQSAMAHRYLYLVNQKMGHYPTALAEAQEAVRLNPKLPGVYNSLGAAYSSMNQYEKAAEAFETAYSMDPTNAGCLMNLASIYLATGRTTEATVALREAVALQPRNPDIYQKLGQAFEKAGDKQSAEEAFAVGNSLAGK